MSRGRLLLSAIAVAAVGAVAGVLIGQRSGDDDGPRGTSTIAADQANAPARAPAFTPGQLEAPPTGWWITNGGDVANRRYSPLNLIDEGNVERLRRVWSADLAPSGGAGGGATQPIFYAGTLYTATSNGDVVAVDADDGSVRWRYDAGGSASAGVALGEGRVYAATANGAVIALDQATGEQAWSTTVLARASIAGAPLYYRGHVIVGAGGDGIRGRVASVNARTGEVAWSFATVPGPFETGGETWRNALRPAGAAVAQTPAVDRRTGYLYFSTGTAWPATEGAERDGDNLFTSSVVAVAAQTGDYAWHFQEVHHDVWGYSAHSPVVLFDVDIGGLTRPIAAQTAPTGWTYLLDRESGEPAAPAPDIQVPQDPAQRTSPSQPIPDYGPFFPARGGPRVTGVTVEDVFDPRLVPVAPGGVQGQAASYSPVTGLLYLCGSEVVLGVRGPAPSRAVPAAGYFGAWDPEEGTVAWRHRWSEPCSSAAVATGGNLVFVGRGDGSLEAYDATTGERRWRVQAGAGALSSVTTFGWRGKQYVAFLAGGRLSLFALG